MPDNKNWKSNYAKKLLDPRWQRKRLEILQRDNFTCQICEDTTKTLHVHHEKYVWGKEPWDYDASDLRTLCVDCHEAVTLLDKDLRDADHNMIETFRRCDFMSRLRIGDKISIERLETLALILARPHLLQIFDALWTNDAEVIGAAYSRLLEDALRPKKQDAKE